MTAPAHARSASAQDRLAGLFPDPSAPEGPWWRRRSRITVAVLIVVALIASTALAARAFGSDSPAYVTATVSRRNVDALLTGVATIEPVSQASVAFPVAGTVSAVNVALGDRVSIGHTLASLDTQSLTDALHQQEAALAQAELTLSKALNGESVGGVGGVGGGASASGSGSFKTTALDTTASSRRIVLTAAGTPSGSGDVELAAAQQAVLTAQKNVDAALSAAVEALDSAATVCAAAGIDPSATPTTSTTTPTVEALTACQTATKNVLAAQTAVSAAQQALATASSALDTLLTQRAAASGNPGSTPGSGTSASGSDQTGSGQPPSGSATSTSPSSSDLVAYQKAVDAATAEVAVAQQAVAQATIASPIAGTVVAVNLVVGETVTAASTTQNIIVVGDGGFEAVTTVGVTKLPAVKVGQRAFVIPDGSTTRLDGSVVSISGTPDASASSTSYRVVIALSTEGTTQAAANGLHNGSTGSVEIVTKRAVGVLAVPTSAVTTTGTRHTVTVLDGSTTERVAVGVGVVGDTWTEITSGVNAGRRVVLADLGEPLPGSATATSSSSTANQRGTTGGFGFPGGGFGGGAGGFPGAPPGN